MAPNCIIQFNLTLFSVFLVSSLWAHISDRPSVSPPSGDLINLYLPADYLFLLDS